MHAERKEREEAMARRNKSKSYASNRINARSYSWIFMNEQYTRSVTPTESEKCYREWESRGASCRTRGQVY